MTQADRAGARVRLRSVLDPAAAEHLRLRLQLDVDLQADDRLPDHGNRVSHLSPLLPLTDAHARRGGTVSNPIARSSAWPTRKSVFSANCGPISCSPTGSPSERPHGMFRPGRPARHDGIVSRSERYMASGFSVFSPRRK